MANVLRYQQGLKVIFEAIFNFQNSICESEGFGTYSEEDIPAREYPALLRAKRALIILINYFKCKKRD